MTSFSRAFRYRGHTKGVLSARRRLKRERNRCARRAAKKDVYAVVPRLDPRDVI